MIKPLEGRDVLNHKKIAEKINEIISILNELELKTGEKEDE